MIPAPEQIVEARSLLIGARVVEHLAHTRTDGISKALKTLLAATDPLAPNDLADLRQQLTKQQELLSKLVKAAEAVVEEASANARRGEAFTPIHNLVIAELAKARSRGCDFLESLGEP